jgi:hypothetical protein
LNHILPTSATQVAGIIGVSPGSWVVTQCPNSLKFGTITQSFMGCFRRFKNHFTTQKHYNFAADINKANTEISNPKQGTLSQFARVLETNITNTPFFF